MSQLYYYTEPTEQHNTQKPLKNLRSLLIMKRSLPIKLEPIFKDNQNKQ